MRPKSSLPSFPSARKYPNIPKYPTLADTLSDNRALTSLNLSSNDLKAEGAQIVAEAIRVTCHCGRFVTICMPIRPLVKLLLFTAIHRIMGRCRP
jgi:hypothetical protein